VSARVLITGASGGIGQAATDALRERGARVVGLDLRADGDDLIRCDVRDQASVDAGVHEAVERLGGLDVLVNNAGVGDVHDAGLPPDEAALSLIDVNMIGPWRVTAAAMPALLESRGRVVNVASGLSQLAVPFAAAYCMSKRGLVAFSDSLRLEYGERVTVTTVYPGYIRTAIHDGPAAKGLDLEGLVPEERVERAGRAVARAALGRPVRDLATSRRAAVGYAILRHLPRRLVDRGVRRQMRRHVRSGRLTESQLVRGYLERLESQT
jgi:NAD(P)-dependent dehydrogenase (short-subunit alcohol dehydrogenase family)